MQELAAAALQALAHPSRRAIAEELGLATATARSPNSPASCASASRRSRAHAAAQASRAGRQPTVGARHLYRLRSDGAGAVRGYIQRVPEDATTGHRLAAANTSRPQPDHLPGCLDAVDLAGPPAHRRLRTGRSAQLSPRQHAMDCRPRLGARGAPPGWPCSRCVTGRRWAGRTVRSAGGAAGRHSVPGGGHDQRHCPRPAGGGRRRGRSAHRPGHSGTGERPPGLGAGCWWGSKGRKLVLVGLPRCGGGRAW